MIETVVKKIVPFWYHLRDANGRCVRKEDLKHYMDDEFLNKLYFSIVEDEYDFHYWPEVILCYRPKILESPNNRKTLYLSEIIEYRNKIIHDYLQLKSVGLYLDDEEFGLFWDTILENPDYPPRERLEHPVSPFRNFLFYLFDLTDKEKFINKVIKNIISTEDFSQLNLDQLLKQLK